MKIYRIAFVSLAAALPQLTWAELPFGGQALATLQATLDFCARLDPQNAPKFQERTKLFLQGTAEDEVVKVRSTDDYKQAYESIRAELNKVNKHEADEACHGLLTSDD